MGEGCSAVLIIDVPNMCDGRELDEHIPIWAFSMSYPIGSVARNDKCGKLSFAINIGYNCKMTTTRHNATYTGLMEGLEGETHGVYFSNCKLLAAGKPIAVEPFVVAEFSINLRYKWKESKSKSLELKAMDGNGFGVLENERNYYRNRWYRPVFGYEGVIAPPIHMDDTYRLHGMDGVNVHDGVELGSPCNKPLLYLTIELTPNRNIRGPRGFTGPDGDWGPDVNNCYTVLVEYKGNCNRVCFVRPKAYYMRQTPNNPLLTVAMPNGEPFDWYHVIQGVIAPRLCKPLVQLKDGSFRYKGPKADIFPYALVEDNVEKGDCINELYRAYNNLRSYY